MKPRITIRLFGRFSVRWRTQDLLLHSSANAKELFCYLVVNRRTPVPRESLATLFSQDVSSEKSRKTLRQALWQLRADLSPSGISCADRLLSVEGGWVQFVADEYTSLDIAEFDRAASGLQDMASGTAAPVDIKRLSQVVELYQGEFLQGWYQEWCLEERERLRQIYLETLDSLVSHCESHRDTNAGVAYAVRALHTDPARECTHRALMRLYCLAGDRGSAIHQYKRCVEACGQSSGWRLMTRLGRWSGRYASVTHWLVCAVRGFSGVEGTDGAETNQDLVSGYLGLLRRLGRRAHRRT